MKTLLALASLALFTMSTTAADGPVFHIVHFKFKADATGVEFDASLARQSTEKIKTLFRGGPLPAIPQ